MRVIVLLAAFLFWISPVHAGSLELDGNLTQGGLLMGRADPGTRVALDGRAVRVSNDGLFVAGFGRSANSQAMLSVTYPDGTTETRTLTVAARKWKIQRIDGLPKRKVTPEKRDLDRIRREGALIAGVRKLDTNATLFKSGFLQPLEGRISGVFGSQRILNGKPRRPHNGLDIAAPKGTPVKAAADGRVALVHQDMFFTGKTVMLDHGHGLSSVYIHMDSILVAEGQTVIKGTPIGTVGMTGRATGPHLHWGVSWFGTHLDPALLVE